MAARRRFRSTNLRSSPPRKTTGARRECGRRIQDRQIASKKWDVVVLQEQSDAALPAGRGANANLPQFGAYVDKIENYIHVGAAESYRERAMYTAIYGSTNACVAAGGTTSTCSNNSFRTIPANPNP